MTTVTRPQTDPETLSRRAPTRQEIQARIRARMAEAQRRGPQPGEQVWHVYTLNPAFDGYTYNVRFVDGEAEVYDSLARELGHLDAVDLLRKMESDFNYLVEPTLPPLARPEPASPRRPSFDGDEDAAAFCTQCGAPHGLAARFCSHCGNPTRQDTSPARPAKPLEGQRDTMAGPLAGMPPAYDRTVHTGPPEERIPLRQEGESEPPAQGGEGTSDG